MTTVESNLVAMGARARDVSRELARVPATSRIAAMHAIAHALRTNADAVLAANAADMKAAEASGLRSNLQDRLLLNPERLEVLAQSVLDVAAMPDPVGEVVDSTVKGDGLRIERRRIPLGVIGLIYESRPNVTVDMAALCLMSGNVAIMRGGSEAFKSNLALSALVRDAIESEGVPADAIQFIEDTDRAYVSEMLNLNKYIDLLIPRGGAALINMVKEKATMPAITGGIGICHTYVDDAADLEKAVAIVHNAKTQRPSVCNALDTVLVHADVAEAFLPSMANSLWADDVELRGDSRTLSVLEPSASSSEHTQLLKRAGDEDYDTEFLGMTAAIRVVDDFDEALSHIEEHGSNHSEAIVTENAERIERFLNEVDAAAVFANSSTRFNDGGEFGLGAEVAVSTNKLHAYGPMGVKEIMSSKWVVIGDGNVRA
jgi:glutamate-5-semialdehyde dehydrogenase